MPEAIRVSFNAWFADRAYRAALARALGLQSSNRGVNKVAPWGPNVWGGSFDNLALDGRASKMEVFSRWRQYIDDPAFRALFDDEDIWTLSQRIFGTIEGTEQLRPTFRTA
jgi:hypothetical protein